MKRIFLIFAILLVLPAGLFSQEGDSRTRLGIQMSSDSCFGVLLYSKHLDIALKAQLVQTDGAAGAIPALSAGGHLGYNMHLFHDETAVSVGAEFINTFGTGDVQYAEKVDAGVRLAVHYPLGEHFLVSGLLYPLYISTEEIEGADDWGLVAFFPKTAVAAAILF